MMFGGSSGGGAGFAPEPLDGALAKGERGVGSTLMRRTAYPDLGRYVHDAHPPPASSRSIS